MQCGNISNTTFSVVNGGFFNWNCRDDIQLPQRGNRIARASQFGDFAGEGFVSPTPGQPRPLRAQVTTFSPARIARLVLLAFRNRNTPESMFNVSNLGSAPRVFFSSKCGGQIVVDTRSPTRSGLMATRAGNTGCILRTAYKINCCDVEQVRSALGDICAVQRSIDSGEDTIASLTSGLDCPTNDQANTEPCISCQCRCPKLDENSLTPLKQKEIDEIIEWLQCQLDLAQENVPKMKCVKTQLCVRDFHTKQKKFLQRCRLKKCFSVLSK